MLSYCQTSDLDPGLGDSFTFEEKQKQEEGEPSPKYSQVEFDPVLVSSILC